MSPLAFLKRRLKSALRSMAQTSWPKKRKRASGNVFWRPSMTYLSRFCCWQPQFLSSLQSLVRRLFNNSLRRRRRRLNRLRGALRYSHYPSSQRRRCHLARLQRRPGPRRPQRHVGHRKPHPQGRQVGPNRLQNPGSRRHRRSQDWRQSSR